MIEKVSEATKNLILQKSAYGLPDRPSDVGMTSSDIKKAFYQPIIDISNSSLAELDRVITSINDELLLVDDKIKNSINNISDNISNLDEIVETSNSFINTLTDLKQDVESLISDINKNCILLRLENLEIKNSFKLIDVEICPGYWLETDEVYPFKYCMSYSVIYNELASVELLNNNPVLFSKYGFSAYMNTCDNIIILALERPEENVSLSFKINGKGIQLQRSLFVYQE